MVPGRAATPSEEPNRRCPHVNGRAGRGAAIPTLDSGPWPDGYRDPSAGLPRPRHSGPVRPTRPAIPDPERPGIVRPPNATGWSTLDVDDSPHLWRPRSRTRADRLGDSEAPELSDESIDRERAGAQGGRHRDLRSRAGYLVVLLAPLAVVFAVAGVSALPSRQTSRTTTEETPSIDGTQRRLALPPPPTPAGSSAPTSAGPTHSPTTGTPATDTTPVTLRSPVSAVNPTLAPVPTDTHPPRGTTVLSFEAETASLGADLTTRALASASGGVIVDAIGKGSAHSVTFTDVVVQSAGGYSMTIWYATATDGRLRVRVNGSLLPTFICPATASADTIGWYTLSVQLDAGRNSIELDGTSNTPVDPDRITIAQPLAG